MRNINLFTFTIVCTFVYVNADSILPGPLIPEEDPIELEKRIKEEFLKQKKNDTADILDYIGEQKENLESKYGKLKENSSESFIDEPIDLSTIDRSESGRSLKKENFKSKKNSKENQDKKSQKKSKIKGRRLLNENSNEKPRMLKGFSLGKLYDSYQDETRPYHNPQWPNNSPQWPNENPRWSNRERNDVNEAKSLPRKIAKIVQFIIERLIEFMREASKIFRETVMPMMINGLLSFLNNNPFFNINI